MEGCAIFGVGHIKPQNVILPKVKHNILPNTLFPLQHNSNLRLLCRVLHLLRKPCNQELKMIRARDDVAEMVKDRLHEPQDILLIHHR